MEKCRHTPISCLVAIDRMTRTNHLKKIPGSIEVKICILNKALFFLKCEPKAESNIA